MSPDGAILTVYIVYALGLLLTLGAVLTWVERKQAAIMADRIGANRAYIRIPFTNFKIVWWGLFHGMADGLKLLLKEDWKPRAYDSLAYALGPWFAFIPVLVVFAVIPFGGRLDPGALFPGLADWFGGRTYPMQIAPMDAGLLVVFAFGHLSDGVERGHHPVAAIVLEAGVPQLRARVLPGNDEDREALIDEVADQ